MKLDRFIRLAVGLLILLVFVIAIALAGHASRR